MLTLAQWLERLEARQPSRIRLGLERCRAVAEGLGLPVDEGGLRLPSVVAVVGGTNGKGSTSALMSAMAQCSGFSTAVYASPHLIQFEERLTFNGELSAADDWVAAFERVHDLEAAAQAAGRLAADDALTYFEFITLAAICMVVKARPDIAIFEVGLGGRLDAVNLLSSDVAVLTSIDLDHQAFLGNTREAIGAEKVAIARAGRPLVVGDPVPPQSVIDGAHQIGADLWRFGEDFNYQGDRQQWSWSGRGQRRNAMAYPALRGANQLLNASAALAALTAIRHLLPLTQGGIRQGLALVALPGRFQVLPGQPAVVLDVAHNPQAAGVLAANLDQMGFFPNTFAVMGMLADKDARAVFERLISRVDHWLLASLDGPDAGPRARSADDLASILRALQSTLPEGGRSGLGPAPIETHGSPSQALSRAVELAEASDRIVVLGSFFTVSAVYDSAQRIGQAPHSPHVH